MGRNIKLDIAILVTQLTILGVQVFLILTK